MRVRLAKEDVNSNYKVSLIDVSREKDFVKITIETPKKLTDKQKELLQKFEESLNEKNYEQKSSFMKKVKK